MLPALILAGGFLYAMIKNKQTSSDDSGNAPVDNGQFDLESAIVDAANANSIDPALFRRLLVAESGLNPSAVSPVGAMGIAQFMPATAEEVLGSQAAAFDPSIAIPGAAKYLAQIRDYVGKGDVGMVAGYNWGMGRAKQYDLSLAPQETKDYVFKILGVRI